MPATALVIGPGVQGQVGRNPASVSAPIGSYGAGELSEYGNAKGLASFTSAGGPEIKARPRRKSSRQDSQEFSPTVIPWMRTRHVASHPTRPQLPLTRLNDAQP